MNSDRTLSELNREAAFSVVRSWTEFLVTLVLLIAAALLLYKSLKYIRAVFKRMTFAAKLRKTCRENGHRLTVTAPLYRSVFFRTTRPELLVETGTDVYSVKLFACVNRKETYVFDGLTRFTTRSNFNPIYLNLRYYTICTDIITTFCNLQICEMSARCHKSLRLHNRKCIDILKFQ